ncbi:GAF domain-containing sensor histidine kinase [Archangium sp.]|uniref:GAF domain-containing sensor histidine kinase n=1 Tax=Archangium sp. TaxID=1872627 RepID=UPI002D3E6544|nr:ATP-binding protein [Archangium sp.]HYO52417.1 ATP-binding protein [Archangium sp.]
MRMPGSHFVAAVERMSRALEQLVSSPSAMAVLQEVVRGAAALLGPSPVPRAFPREETRGRWVESARTTALRARAEAEQAELLRLTRFQAVTEAFGRALTREDVGQAVLELGVPAVGAVGGTVHQASADGRSVELVAAVGTTEEQLAPLRSMPREMSEMPGHDAVARGMPVWLESVEEARARYPAFAAYVASQSCQAFAFLPLRVEQHHLGLLAFGFAQARHFTELQRTLMLGLARQCAQALERARLYETERTARLQAEAAGQRLQLLADAGVLLSGSLEWETTVAGVARLAVGGFSDWCAVDFLDEHGALRRLTVQHVHPERAPLNDKIEVFTPEQARPSAITDVVRTGRSQLVIGLVPPFTRKVVARPGERPEGGSFIIVPMVARQRTLGAISFARGPERTPFTDADRSLAEDLAARAGLAIDNARLLRKARAAEAESRRNAARLRILVEVDRLLAEAGLDMPAVLNVIARKVSEVIGDGCVLQLTAEDGAFLEPVAIHHPEPEARWLLAGTVHARQQKLGEGLHGGAASSGRAVLLPDIDVGEARACGGLPEYLPYLDRYGPQSLLVVPLAVKGRVFGSLGVVRDVAGGRPYGEEDQMLLQSLAERAALAIEDARLYGAATEAVRLRDDFLSVAGHELKTPLSALRLQIQMLARMTRDVATTPGLVQRVEKAERTSERLGALIDELLDAGRITSGRLKLEREEVDLAALARDTVGRMSEALARAGSEVKLVADAAVPGRWDRVRLEQVVGNLLSNAAKYGRGQPVEVRVETGHEGRARLVVKDNGIGISPEDQARIFERFERAALAIEDARLYGAATEAVRLRDDFLSGAGHERTTPLSALRLQIQMLARMTRDVATTPGLVQRVEKAERTSERLGALIDELLDAGRITSGRLKLEREEVDLAALARDTVGRMSEALARAGSEVKLVADAAVPGRWDRVRLEQVVGNLLSNAAKYGRGQPVEVRVETGHDGRARLVVKDNGIGISPEDQARIFERFERAADGKQFHGLGLGLWISREIVESHGGHIVVRSALGAGSTFTVELPRE